MTCAPSREHPSSRWTILPLAVSLALVSIASGCEAEDPNARVDPTLSSSAPPSGEAFRPVAQVLVDRCASLDCHGSKYRNMFLRGFGTARLDPNDHPDAPETTSAEVDHDYDAVVALEPEVLRAVMSEGGTRPERLTFVRKARGAEAHKGGGRVVPGDAADVCITSWLQGSVDATTCKAAVPRFAEP